GDGVMLSDLFANVPPEGDGRIAESPAPGERLVFGARQLLHYARSFRLRWSPQNAKVYAEVVRDSMPVPLEVLRDALVREIDTQRATDDYEVEIFNRDLPLFVATGTKPELVVRNLVLDNRSNRFDASVSLAGSNAAPVVVNGRLEPMLDVPVLRIHAMPGDLIGEADVQWIRIEARRAGANTVTRLEDLIGRTPRRPIAAGQAVRITDVRPNFVINRGDLVTIVLRSGTMTLTASAEAMERGAVGSVIRVRNNHSRRILETRVLAADTVAVVGPQAASLD
ncbi:MAG TPA: flagellar basal body P-ring formation chaperone FlgA, partial [Thalassobaculum sp.]